MRKDTIGFVLTTSLTMFAISIAAAVIFLFIAYVLGFQNVHSITTNDTYVMIIGSAAILSVYHIYRS